MNDKKTPRNRLLTKTAAILSKFSANRVFSIVAERTAICVAVVRILFVGFLLCQCWGQSHAQCGSVTGSTIPLYWDANSEPDLDHYNVYRSLTSGSGYSAIGTTSQSADPISFTDLTPLATGYYGVTAVNTSGLESGLSNQLCVQLTGGTGNVAPVITGQDALTTEEETFLPITVSVLTVSDPDNSYPEDFTVPVVQSGLNYTRNLNSITPVTDFNGILTVPVTVNDGTVNSDVFNLSVAVTAVNDAPVITGHATLTTDEETPLTITLSDVTVSDPDNSYPADFTLAVQDRVNYTRSVNTITPVTDFDGILTVPVSVNDGSANSNLYNLSVMVTAVNDAPTAADDSATTDQDAAVIIDVLSNDSDPDGDTPALDSVAQPSNGSVVINPDGTVTYRPASNFNGIDSFSYIVGDGQGATDTAIVTVTVTATATDADGDGVGDSVEDQAPNNGDGNNDGIPDKQQSNVASLPDSVDGRYATLVSQTGTDFVDVRATGSPSAGNAPAEADFVVGFFEFTVQRVPVGQATTVILFLEPGSGWNTYWKFGPTPGNPIPHWYEFFYDGTVGAEILSDRIILHLVDGGRGDDDLVANGEILDQGGPAFSTPAVIPAMLSTGVPSTDNPYVGMAILNPNDYPNEVFLSVVDSSGTEMNSIDLEGLLPARGQTSFLTRDVLGAASSDLSVIARGVEGPVQSFFLIGDNGLTKLDGLAGEFRASAQLYFPVVRLGNNTSTLLFVFNPGLEDASGVAFRLFDQNGGLVQEVLRTIPSGLFVSLTVDDLFGVVATGEEYHIQVEATVPLMGFEVVEGPEDFSALAAQLVQPAQRLLVPHFFVDNQGNTTEIRLLSRDTTPVTVRVKAFEDTSVLLAETEFQLAPGALFVSEVRDLLNLDPTGLFSGYLELELGGADVMGVVTFSGPSAGKKGKTSGRKRKKGNQGQYRASLPMIQSGRTAASFLHVAQSNQLGLFTGLAILNAESQTTSVTVRAFDVNGNQSAETVFVLEAGSRLVEMLNEDSFFGRGFSQVGGHLEVISTTPVVIFMMFGDFELQFLSAVEGQTRIR